MTTYRGFWLAAIRRACASMLVVVVSIRWWEVVHLLQTAFRCHQALQTAHSMQGAVNFQLNRPNRPPWRFPQQRGAQHRR